MFAGSEMLYGLIESCARVAEAMKRNKKTMYFIGTSPFDNKLFYLHDIERSHFTPINPIGKLRDVKRQFLCQCRRSKQFSTKDIQDSNLKCPTAGNGQDICRRVWINGNCIPNWPYGN